MFLVYIETLKMSIGDERLEKLANAINFRDDGGIFSRENYCFCGKDEVNTFSYNSLIRIVHGQQLTSFALFYFICYCFS